MTPMDDVIESMKGRALESISISPSKEEVTFLFASGQVQRFRTEGDCCSRSWIEHVEYPRATADVSGLMITGATHVDKGVKEDPDHECLKLYETRFHTSVGDIVLEYRNSSNGYYGGSLEPA